MNVSPQVSDTYWIPQERSTDQAGVFVLLDQTLEIPINPDASDALKLNLSTAKKIIEYVRGIILVSPNFPLRSGIKTQEEYQKILIQEDTLEEEMFREAANTTDYLQKSNALAKIHKIGSCKSMGAVGFFYAKEAFPNQKIGLCNIKGGDHIFLIVGIGPDSVVCDPWAKGCYRVVELAKYMRNYIRVDRELNTLVKPIDLSTQSITVYDF